MINFRKNLPLYEVNKARNNYITKEVGRKFRGYRRSFLRFEDII